MTLDQSDLQILYYLKQNSRISLTELGKYIGLTPAAINYRLQKLIENNIIKNFTIEINHEKLTPNYQSFYLKAKLSRHEIPIQSDPLSQVFFREIHLVADSFNLLAITYPLDTDQVRKLIEFLENTGITDYSLVPIINSTFFSSSMEIRGENIQKLYCPECQAEMTGKAIIVEVDKMKLMAFCCDDCKNNFLKRYENITQSAISS